MVFGGLCLWNGYSEMLEKPAHCRKPTFKQCTGFSSFSEQPLHKHSPPKTMFKNRLRDTMVFPWRGEIPGSCPDAVRYHALFRDQRFVFRGAAIILSRARISFILNLTWVIINNSFSPRYLDAPPATCPIWYFTHKSQDDIKKVRTNHYSKIFRSANITLWNCSLRMTNDSLLSNGLELPRVVIQKESGLT